MWKPAGVVCLWLMLIAVPHLRPSVLQMSIPGVQVATTLPGDDPPADLGDPPLAARRASHGPDAGVAGEESGAFATIRFKSGLDKTLTLLQANLEMDGEPLAPVTNLKPQGENVVFSGHVTPGAHVVTTRLTVQGQRRGPFTYTQGYRWQVRSEQTLNVLPNRALVFTISAVRHKGINVPLNEQVEISIFNELLPGPVSESN